MQIGPTNGSGSHFDNGIAWLKKFWVRDTLDTNIARAMPTKGFHRYLPLEQLELML